MGNLIEASDSDLKDRLDASISFERDSSVRSDLVSLLTGLVL